MVKAKLLLETSIILTKEEKNKTNTTKIVVVFIHLKLRNFLITFYLWLSMWVNNCATILV